MIGGEDRRRNDQPANNAIDSEDRPQGFGGGKQEDESGRFVYVPPSVA